MGMNSLPSEDAAVLDALHPVSRGAGGYMTGWIDASKFERYMVVGQNGLNAANAGSFTLKLQCATAANTNVGDIAGKTAVMQANNSQVVINLRREELANGAVKLGDAQYFRAHLQIATVTQLSSVVVYGFDPVNGPASDSDNASVQVIKA